MVLGADPQAWSRELPGLLRAWAAELDAHVPAIAGALAHASYRGAAADRDRAALEDLAERTGALAHQLEAISVAVAGLIQRLEGRR